MEFGLWEKYYTEILEDFGFSRENDEESAKLLDEILSTEGCLTLEDLKGFVDFSDKFIIFGAGPSLKEHVLFLKENYDLKDYVLVAADGATTALIEQKIAPDIVATDLDGNLDDIMLANVRGANIAIHAHGDNIEKIAGLTPFFTSVLGTTQAQPVGNLYNFGGFTDGDRAIFLAVALNAREITLAGMDFGDIVTRYSRPNIESDTAEADEFKKKKLIYAERLTQWIIDNEDVEIINLCERNLL
ncbi:6-hydroxymethylpterin diphosphokinase MptE-like protein [Methanobrevibacter sp.]